MVGLLSSKARQRGELVFAPLALTRPVGGLFSGRGRKGGGRAIILRAREISGFSLNSVEDSAVDTSELRLVDRAAAGDREAQRELFERYRDAAYRVAFRITGRQADALDAVQDSFIRAFERLSGFQREARFKTWLLRIVTNRALDLLRARKVRLAIPLDGDDEAGPVAAVADHAAPPPGEPLERRELAQRLGLLIGCHPSSGRSSPCTRVAT
jgi:RNA polymerase sigma factor (sigma-70 family)